MERRFWLGAGILAVFLALGLWVSASMTQIHTPVADQLEQASQAAISGDLAGGISLARQAQDEWESHWSATAAVADHAPMDEIDGLFLQMQAYGTAGAAREFAATSARLSALVEAMYDAHRLTWWNLM